MPDLAVVIVTWNVRDLALEAVRSLLADVEANGPATDVYVVDSASSDGTVDAITRTFPNIHVVASEENIGFGRANNLGMNKIGFGRSNADLPNAVYLLNPDTITQPGATRTLYNALMNDMRNGLVGAQLNYGDGSIQHGAFTFPGLRQLWVEFFPTPGRLIESEFNGRYSRAHYRSGKPFEVDFVLGATMMLRREVIEQTGMFDEAFFMYCEEVDWAWRIHKAGWRVLCVPEAHVTHLGGQSSAQVRPRAFTHLWTSRLLLFRRYYPPWKYALAKRMIMTGLERKLRDPALPAEIATAYQTVYELTRTS
jgi:hypothetical protein